MGVNLFELLPVSAKYIQNWLKHTRTIQQKQNHKNLLNMLSSLVLFTTIWNLNKVCRHDERPSEQ